MADRSHRRKSRRQQLKSSHQKNWLTGRYAIAEALAAGVWPIAELYLEQPRETEDAEQVDLQDDQIEEANAEGRPINDAILTAATERKIEPVIVSRDRLSELCGSRHHQGVAARMGDFPYRKFDEQFAVDRQTASPSDGLVLLCDRIQDSHNFGAMLRCCDGMNVSAVIVASQEQAAVSPQVARSSAGAVNHVPIVLVEDLSVGLLKLKSLGFHAAAATEKTECPAWSTEVTGPTVLVIGNEATGVDEGLLAQCDSKLMIPMQGHVSSLNAAVATGILLYELRRRKATTTE